MRVRELTAPGRGGVSVLSVSGPGALERVRALAPGIRLGPGELRLVRLRSGGELVDEALLWAASEEEVELSLHGSPPLVRLVARLLGGDAPPASPPSLEEEAAELCARAASEAAARMLLDQSRGALRRELERIRDADEEEASARIAALVARSRVARHLVAPPRVVLAGPANAGKSTLFNALVGHERVVVDPEHGTTRDAVRERVLLGAYAVELIDTAGERELVDASSAARVERAGRELARELRAGADLVIWLDPAGRGPTGARDPRVRVVVGRADELAPGDAVPGPRVSGRDAPAEACTTIRALFHEALGLPETPWTPGAAAAFTPEQRALLERLRAGEGGMALESLLAR